MRSDPVSTTQRASSPGTVAAIASRISRSRALRLAGLWTVSRATPSAGSSSSSLPEASSVTRSLEDDQRVALGDRLALLAADLLDGAVVLGLDGHLHLHRLEDDERVALRDLLADLALDLPHGAGDVRLDVWQRFLLGPWRARHDSQLAFRPWPAPHVRCRERSSP